MPGKLFLLEVIANKITFESNYKPIPDRNDILINIRFSDIINVDIVPENIMEGEANKGPNETVLNLFLGKTYLFTYNSKSLRDELKKHPLELSLLVQRKSEATAFVPWKKEFAEMVKIFESIGVVKSVDFNGNVDLKNNSGEKIGNLEFYIRMSCFEDGIETDFKMNEAGSEYVFMNPKTMKFFKCEGFDPKVSDIHPISVVYNPVLTAPPNTENQLSWTELFGGKPTDAKLSVSPFIIDDDQRPATPSEQQGDAMLAQSSAFDVVSMCFRPPENKFFDFLNLISAEVNANEEETLVTVTMDKHKSLRSREEVSSHVKKSVEVAEDPLELTADKISRKLCKNKDCPAAKKFKEFGIGPLATGKGLGTIYGDVEPPVHYGLSQTFGTLSNYGPYGVFTKPKSPDQPFVGQKREMANDATENCKTSQKQKLCRGCSLRLRGGGPIEGDTLLKTDLQAAQLNHNPHILRLKGGSPLGLDDLQGPKSPFIECKPVMEQFDKILAAYRKALGPCGEATCPYTQNLAEEQCKQACDKPKLLKSSESDSCKSIPCTMEECPYMEPKKTFPAGCGSPNCAYTKYKLGLVDDDAAIELQFLPPAISGKCGHPKCKYPLESDLPPIHWDCPDPLPKENCRNPNCPLQPPDLRALKCPGPRKTACGSTDCPYALPAPCDLPSCPFRQKPCPFLEKQKLNDENSCCSTDSVESEVCENPDCPFAKDSTVRDTQSASLDDPAYKGQFVTCANPNCPFASKLKPKKENICSNPDCPFAKKPKLKNKGNVCENPDCPSVLKNESKNWCKPDCGGIKSNRKNSSNINDNRDGPNIDVCSNPDCPFTQKQKRKTSNLCANPECPFATKKASSGKDRPSNGKGSSSEEQEKCPKKDADSTENQSVCDNPECPFSNLNDKRSVCNDPFCPYLQPLPSCGIPNCPYEPKPLLCRPSPNRPAKDSKKKLINGGSKDVEEVKRNSICAKPDNEGTEVILVEETVMVCDNETSGADQSLGEDGSKGRKKGSTNDSKNVKGKRKKRGKFVYSMGDKYPGVKVGHKECVMPVFNVPPKMGWLWNIHEPILNMKPRRGWKPGAIVKTIAARIRAHRQAKGLGMLRVPKFRLSRTGDENDVDIDVTPKPTLHIQKKEGAYWITMNPLKDPKTLAENEDPYMDCTPMQFKIVKNKEKQKREGQNEGLIMCCCEDEEDNSSSSDSELDIEFTPPAGIIHPERFKKKKNVIHCDTQYDPADFEVKKRDRGKDKGKEEKGGKGKGGKGKGGKAKGGKGKGGKGKGGKGEKGKK